MDVLFEITNWVSDFFVQSGTEFLENIEKEGGLIQESGKAIKKMAANAQDQ
ncbi:MAG: hypothetical protein JKY54_03730, partial [Flavobacteriales bacterium]|nr:hypothetical protein [Flavobacteriales bacterium]